LTCRIITAGVKVRPEGMRMGLLDTGDEQLYVCATNIYY
jgi:hypothetical protein